jgi:hypothetical protein
MALDHAESLHWLVAHGELDSKAVSGERLEQKVWYVRGPDSLEAQKVGRELV